MSHQPAAEPPRVRLYGLVSLTRRRYLIQLSVAFVLAGGLLLLWYFRWPTVRKALQEGQSPVVERIIGFWDAAPWFIGALAALQVIEAFFVLRAFRKKAGG